MWRPRPSSFMTASSLLLAFAPKCPVCFLAYFGVFGVVTASASACRVWLPPITALWLALTIGLLIIGRSTRGRVGPVLLAVAASIAIFSGRFILEDRLVIIAGLSGLIAATLWRAWTRRPALPCDQCLAAARNRKWKTEKSEEIISTQSL